MDISKFEIMRVGEEKAICPGYVGREVSASFDGAATVAEAEAYALGLIGKDIPIKNKGANYTISGVKMFGHGFTMQVVRPDDQSIEAKRQAQELELKNSIEGLLQIFLQEPKTVTRLLQTK